MQQGVDSLKRRYHSDGIPLPELKQSRTPVHDEAFVAQLASVRVPTEEPNVALPP
jgi:hypothetical protein